MINNVFHFDKFLWHYLRVKNFIYLLSIPISFLICFLVFIITYDETDFERYREIPLHKYCSSSDDYVKCVFNNSPIGDFEDSVLRKPYPDNDYVKNDEGGCDISFLGGFKYTNTAQDYQERKKFLNACNPYIVNAYNIGTGLSGELINNNYLDTMSVTLFQMLGIEPSDKNLTDEMLSRFKKYIQNPYLTKDDSGKTNSEIVEWVWQSKKPEFIYKGYTFSYGWLFLAVFPILVAFYIYLKFFQSNRPIFTAETFNWLQSKKKFRVSILMSTVWFLIWLIILFNLERRVNPFDNSDAWFFYIYGIYPLLTIISSRFIVTAEDK